MAVSSLNLATSVMFSHMALPRFTAFFAAFSSPPLMLLTTLFTCSRLIFLLMPFSPVSSCPTPPAAVIALLPRSFSAAWVSIMPVCAASISRAMRWYASLVGSIPAFVMAFRAASAWFAMFFCAAIRWFSVWVCMASVCSLFPSAFRVASSIFICWSRVFTSLFAAAIPLLKLLMSAPIFTLGIFSHPYPQAHVIFLSVIKKIQDFPRSCSVNFFSAHSCCQAVGD